MIDSATTSIPRQLSRRRFLVTGITALGLPTLEVTAKSFGQSRQLLKPIHEQIVCPWSPRHPRNDHQLIFPLDDQRLLLVWSEYYSTQKNRQQQIGKSGVGDSVSCQIVRLRVEVARLSQRARMCERAESNYAAIMYEPP
jgi:hypothetical protein